MKKALLLCALGTALLGVPAAHADSTFDFSFTGTNKLTGALFSGNGVFNATYLGVDTTAGADYGLAEYQITSVSDGSITTEGAFGTTSDITSPNGLLSVDAFQGNDNILFYPGGTAVNGTSYFDHDGVSFSLDNGNDVNLNVTLGFENAVDGTKIVLNDYELDSLTVTEAPAATPEPGSLALLGTSILGGAGLLRRRFKARA